MAFAAGWVCSRLGCAARLAGKGFTFAGELRLLRDGMGWGALQLGMMSELSRVNVEIDDGTGVMVLVIRSNSVNDYEAGVIEEAILEAGPGGGWRLALDFSEVAFLASAGIGMVITVHRACAKEKGKMVVFGLNKEIANVLKMCHLDKLFTITADRAKAVKKLK